MPFEATEATIAWDKGGTASFLAVEGEAVTVRSSISAPPGARLDATFIDEPRAAVRIKVHACKRQEDGAFTIKGRLFDATRELRERVAALAR